MAKQLNLLSGQVISTPLHAEMQQSYLEYAMSVIVGRALPDVRDGLKPVHRRILYAMHELGLTPDRPYRKCARVVGDVLGKYHPHGDQSVYDALVRMVQEFSSRYPLLAGHGNFGSVDNDPAAAMRYTETRLAPIAHEAMLTQVGDATVDFAANFDSSEQEPTALPAQLPFLLLNGCTGIAVGMATNIPPHNLGEVVDGLIALIENPEVSDEKLIELIPGPDFPTGGEIVATQGIVDAYTKGRGSIAVRGVAGVEEVPGNRKVRTKTAIVVTEFPFQVNKASWIEKVADLVNAGRLDGISDLRDESDRDGIRVVIELKREFTPEAVLARLYQQTDLQTNFGAILLAIVNGQPRQLTLRQLLQEFLDFREVTLTRRYNYELHVAERRCHIVQGLMLALTNLDTTIDILRNSPDGTTAKQTFQVRLDLSESQSDAILAMPMRRLTGLERQHLQAELDDLTGNIQELQRLLSDRRELLKALKKELRSLKRKYADPRRTKFARETGRAAKTDTQFSGKKNSGLKQLSPATIQPNLLPVLEPEETIVEFSHKQYVRRLPANDRPRSKRIEKSVSALEKNEDFIVTAELTKTDRTLVVLTPNGKAYPLKVADIPSSNPKDRGKPIVGLLSPSATKDSTDRALSEITIAHFILPENSEGVDLVTMTQQGKIKRLPMQELADVTNRGMTVVKLKEDDRLRSASLSKVGEQVAVATSGGRVLRFDVDDEQLPPMGRSALGSQVTRLRKQEVLVGCITIDPEDSLVLFSELGWAKRMPAGSVRLTNRGEIGTQAFRFAEPKDALVGLLRSVPGTDVKLFTTSGRLLRSTTDAIAFWGKDAPGDRVFDLNPGEKIIKVISSQ
ncbi:DNA topoisomerase 4 subunit A [Tychonema sp. LEGE 07199]|uniref:DNA gyrase/topoisomerase IV subunit A n=1 Tax=unclassified Tychonema TaxID=2642144 RepID=UPI0018810031|nr:MULTISPECIES: DNA topoisomerase (ATP-hydrolyzing) [unclassified Tychonema]MBE9121119.1 DNA topoisomerase 4 subunit A [Tychonema sp. LEGE 07199]MBE9132267.1 DNA topoisomerase 4 subunit A [Tychonema sp. LEGE 07196]